jgi:tRNA threonylcarbamoyladenosine biosynthesis protein TsaB
LSRRAGPATAIGFDTATDDTAVCVVREGELIHDALIGPPAAGRPQHATALLAEVERGVGMAGGWGPISLLAAGVGPGSYTGLRIGLATARGLRAALGIPVVGVCTLDALARGIGELGEGRPRLALLDARRGEIFAALYASDGRRLWEPAAESPAGLARRVGELGETPLAAGSGAVRFRAELGGGGIEIPEDSDPVHRVSARHVCALGVASGAGDARGLEPIYLRSPDAERWRERDTAARDRR